MHSSEARSNEGGDSSTATPAEGEDGLQQLPSWSTLTPAAAALQAFE